MGGGEAPTDLPVPGVGTLHLNETVDTPQGLMVRALRLESPLGDVVIGEARVGLGSPPCASGLITIRVQSTPPETRSFSFGGDLGVFPLDSGRPDGVGAERTFRRPPGRYRVEEAAGADGDWSLEALECQDPNGSPSGIDLPGRAATVALRNGGAVVCVFHNASAGHRSQAQVGGIHIEADLKSPPKLNVLGCTVHRGSAGEAPGQSCPNAPGGSAGAGGSEPPPAALGPRPGGSESPPGGLGPGAQQPPERTEAHERPGWFLPAAVLFLVAIVLLISRRRRHRAAARG